MKHLYISFYSNIFWKIKSKLFHVKQSRNIIVEFKENIEHWVYILPDVNYIIFEIMCMIDEIVDVFVEFDS